VLVAKAAALADSEFGWAADMDWNALGRGCEAQLDRTNALVEGADFNNSLAAVLSAAKAKLASGYVRQVSRSMLH
jgi:hypothetical protein